jgi:hypothetical protein
MTSQVNPNNIDGTYPIAGQDNDSQGFRDNFTNIRNNLTYVKAEIEDLQNKAVLKSPLLTGEISNDLMGNAIVGATLTGWRETYYEAGNISGSYTVDFTRGNFQKITLAGPTSLLFSWPTNTSGQYASIKLWVNVTNSAYTLAIGPAPTIGDADTIAGYNAGTITFNSAELANNQDYFFEIFTFNKGTTLGIKDLIRNRDVDLSGKVITGSLAVDNISSNANVVITNGIFWSANGLPFSPSFAGTGNITTSDDVVAGGNVWAQGGHFRTSASTAYLANTTPTTGFLLGGATQIWIGAITGNVTTAGNLVANANVRAGSFVPTSTSIPSTGMYSGGTSILGFATANTERWYINASGSFVPVTDNAVDIGNGTTNPRDIYASRNIIASSNVVAAATTTSVSSTTGALVVRGGTGIAGNIYSTGNLLTSGAGAGIGYIAGAGGAVTQGTSRTTAVTLSPARLTGAITMFSAAGSATPATFTVDNALVAATDTIILSVRSSTNPYAVFVTAVTTGSFNITFYSLSGTATDAPVINFSVIKGAAS